MFKIKPGLTSTLAGTFILLAAFLVVCATPVSAEDIEAKIEKDNRPLILPGFMAPDFTVVDMDGNEFTLSEACAEQPVVIDFWATWCGPCRAEIPVLNEFARIYMDEVTVIGITSEGEDSTETILDFAEENEIVYRIVQHPEREVSAMYGVTGIPHLVIIGTDCKIIGTHTGYSTEMDLIGDLEHELGLINPHYCYF